MNNCDHDGTLSLLDVENEEVSCEECGHTQPADPYDIANQYRLYGDAAFESSELPQANAWYALAAQYENKGNGHL